MHANRATFPQDFFSGSYDVIRMYDTPSINRGVRALFAHMAVFNKKQYGIIELYMYSALSSIARYVRRKNQP